MSVIRFPSPDVEGPSAAELAAIDAEWPLIAAELDLLDAEITLIAAGPAVSALDRRRVRRAARRVLAVGSTLADSRGLAEVDAEFGAEGVA